MVSKNNQWQHLRASAPRVPHYGLRKLSVGVASVLLSTTLYMGVSAHADTVITPSETATSAVVTLGSSGTETTGNAAGSSANVSSTNSVNSASEVPSSQGAPANSAMDVNSDIESPAETPAQPAMSASSTAPKSVVRAAVKPVANVEAAEPTKLATMTWTIHYVDENNTKLVPDTVISHDYQRTDTASTIGDYKYVDGSLKVTGTNNTGYHIDAPDFKYNQTIGGNQFDVATWQIAALKFDGYRPDYGSVALSDELTKDPGSLGSTSHDYSGGEFTFHYTLNPKTVTINYVNDDDNEKIVGTGTVSGKPNTEVTITPNLPSGYMLTPGKDVPSTYTVTDGDNQAVTIHVQKQFVDVSDTNPQAKQTRTITLHYVYAGGPKDGQTAFDDAVLDVYYHRTATFDRGTNQTTYGDWTWDQSQGDTSTPGYRVVSGKWTNLPQSWATVTADVPSIKGYHADLGQNDSTNINHVPANTWVFPTYNNAGGAGSIAYLDGHGYEVGPTHTIKYVPNQTTVTVNYVDDDNKGAVVGSQHWDGTTGQHIELTLTPPANYVLSPFWVNPSSYDFDGVNSSWYTVHVKHVTQDVTDQQPKDRVTKVTRLTRNHLYGNGPHKGEKFAEPDIFDLAWKRTATKDLVTGDVTFGNWQVNWDDSKSVQGRLTARPTPYMEIDGMLYPGKDGYSCLGDNSHSEFVRADGSVKVNGWNKYGWQGAAELEAYPVLNYYYGPGQVNIPVYYIDADTGQKVAEKINDDALTGNDFRDGNTVTIDQSKLTSLLTTLTGYQLLPGQTLPTSYKIDTFAGVKGIKVQVVKDRSVKITFVDDDNKEAVVGTPTTITGHTGGDPVALDLTVPDKYQLVNGQQLPTTYTFTKGSGDVTIHLAKDRSVKITFVDNDYNGAVVGTPTTIIGHTGGDPVVLDLTVPENYKLADSQQLPTSYTFIKGSGDVTIHLVHQIVQREATIDVQLKLVTLISNFVFFVTTQTQWTQLKDNAELTGLEKTNSYNMMQSVEVGTLTGYVNYDLVDGQVVSFGDGWTSLNLSGQIYQLPNGTDVVNGIVVDGGTYGLWGKKFKEIYLEGLESLPNVDPDYINLPWHGYLSVNATSDPKNYEIANIIGLGLQAGLVGDEPNALAKANGDHAATGVETVNKTVDLSLLKDANT